MPITLQGLELVSTIENNKRGNSYCMHTLQEQKHSVRILIPITWIKLAALNQQAKHNGYSEVQNQKNCNF